jgi:hypothetical protein
MVMILGLELRTALEEEAKSTGGPANTFAAARNSSSRFVVKG